MGADTEAASTGPGDFDTECALEREFEEETERILESEENEQYRYARTFFHCGYPSSGYDSDTSEDKSLLTVSA